MTRKPLTSGKPRRLLMTVATITLVLTGGILLLADVPGPKPDTKVSVESFTPTGTTDQKTNISIRFSNDLVPADSVGRPTGQIPVTFEPRIAGLARWVNPDLLMIYPDKPLLPATHYKATVRAGGGYVNGNAIREEHKFEFSTPPLSVRVTRHQAQRIRNRGREARLVVNLEFNHPVDIEQLRKAATLKGEQNASSGTVSFITPETSEIAEAAPAISRTHRLVSEPFDLKGGEQKYRIELDRGFRCVGCGEGLAEKYEYIMTVPSNPAMELWIENVRAVTPGKQGSIEVYFSSRVTADEVRDHVTIDPPIDFTVETRWSSAVLHGDFRPQSTYTVNITAGIVSADGVMLEQGFEGKVQMGDIPATVRFTSPGVYLPREGNRLLEVETINIDTLSIEVEQIFANNLVGYLAGGKDRGYEWQRQLDLYGRRLSVKDFGLSYERNTELLSSVDIGKMLGDTLRGVFQIAARNKSSRWTADTRHVMITDIGIMARLSDRYVMVWANGLSDTEPIKKAEVKLFSRNNQLLLEGKTNSRGVALFPDAADLMAGYDPYLITVEKDGDLAYLRLDNSRLPTSDFDVSGRPYLARGYETFVYFDRGVFRPGETVHVVSVIRGKDGVMPESFPYRLKVTDPRGRKFAEYRIDAGQVMAGLDIDLPMDAATGRYTAVVMLGDDEELGRGSFLVEEFVPDRIKVTVETDKDDYLITDELQVTITGRMLYGPPASGHRTTAEVVLRPQDFRPPGFSAYTFADDTRTMAVSRTKLTDTVLSDSGIVTYRHKIDKGLRPPAQLQTQIWATVLEQGGRGVSSFKEVTVHPYPRYLGIKTNLESYARTGEPVTAKVIALNTEGAPVAADSVLVRFSRLVYNSMLRSEPDGSYRFVSEETEEMIDSIWVSVGQSGAEVTFTPQNYGRYRIVARDTDGGHVTAVRFYASGWGQVPWSMAEPDKLDLGLDRETYTEGSRAKLQVRAPFGGKLLLTVENETVRKYMTIDMPDNTAEIEIPVEREFSPNVYITGTLIRPASEIVKHAPARAFGMVPLVVVPQQRRLAVEIEIPEKARPHDTIPVLVKTDGSVNTHITIAAVDAGVLQLTDFTTPDPFEFFYGKRRPALAPYDIYSFVYPETEPRDSHLSPAGGRAGARAKRHLNPFAARRIKVVSLWSGIVTADTSGNAEVKLALPQFNGQLVMMVVAADANRFGSATADMLVRDKIVLQESFPRFVAPGDIVNGMITVFNGMDSTATIDVTLTLDGQAALVSPSTQQVKLAANTEGSVTFQFRADRAPGKVEVDISAKSGREYSRTSFEMSNRPGNPLTVKFGSGTVTADSAARFMLPSGWVPGTDEYDLRTSSLAAVRVMRNIEYLLRYPYGCVEQTTSALFPLLYFDDLARGVRPALFGGKGHEYYVTEGIERLLRFQRDDGSFAYWPGSDRINNWSAVYAGDFLVEAQNAGYEIESKAFKRVLDFLTQMARGKKYDRIKTEQRVYACYALAKAGKLEKKLINYLGTVNTNELPAYSRYQLAAALAMTGDIEQAKELVPFEVQPDLSEPEDGGNLSSGVRTNAILLDLLLTVDRDNPSTHVLAGSLLEQARINRWYNTQSTAFALTALGKFFKNAGDVDFVGKLSIVGDRSYSIDTAYFRVTKKDIGGKEVTIDIEGQGPCYYYWQASGIPISPEEQEFERGIKVYREYLDDSGNPVDLKAVALGDQLVARITIQSTGKSLRNVVINDMLPAGFEIENPRLATTPTMPWIPTKLAAPDYQDIRDDRLLLFVDLPSTKTRHFYYSLRAIASGEFSIPPVAAECMYNPLIAGASSSGMLMVTSKQ